MAKKSAQKNLHLSDSQKAELRMQAITVASRLPEATYLPGVTHPGRTASNVVQDADLIMNFVMKK